MLKATISLQDACAHLWRVRFEWQADAIQNQQFINLANWVPGSYMIRDFSRHIVSIRAYCNDAAIALSKVSKSRWSLIGEIGRYVLEMEVYAFDLSVRASYLDQYYAFFDGACLLPWLDDRQQEAYQIVIDLGAWGRERDWQVATAMPQVAEFTFQAASYWEAIDHPFTLGRFVRFDFDIAGIAHQFILSGQYLPFDSGRLLADIEKICTAHLELFGAAPFSRYVFMLYVGDHLYGGLEHRASTALMADRWSLPRLGAGSRNDEYVQLLGLISHEYFHAWNVKSIKPAAFDPYDLRAEQYTPQLWAFEGITSYYDDLILQRCGVMSTQQYLTQLAKTITRVEQGAGGGKQTLAESSFDAWTKYYQQNENSANAIVSYYQKGALAALVLDLFIRRETDGEFSLDDVMRALFRRYLQDGRGISEADWRALAYEVTGVEVASCLHAMIDSTGSLPLASILADFGIALTRVAQSDKAATWLECLPNHLEREAALGAQFVLDGHGLKINSVANGGGAEQAGLAAGDVVIAVAHMSVRQWETWWQTVQIGEQFEVHYFRQGVLYQTVMEIQAAHATTVLLHTDNAQLLSYWLPQW